MQKTFYILYFGSLLLFGCQSQKRVVLPNQSLSNAKTLEIKGNVEIKEGSTATFELTNSGLSPITIFAPWQKRIEKFENNSWRAVRIISCPCGASCSSPPKTMILQPAEKHVIDWNLMEGWCDRKQENGISKTIENISSEGLYRVSVDYSIDGIERLTITKEFRIIN